MSTFKDRLEKTLWILYVPSFYFCLQLVSAMFADIVSTILFQNAEVASDVLEGKTKYFSAFVYGYAPVYLFLNWLIFNKKDFLPKHIDDLSYNKKLGLIVLYIAWLILLIISNKV